MATKKQRGRAFQEALDLARGVGDEVTVAQSLCALAASARRSGDLDRAGALVREALTLQTDMGAKLGIAGSLEELAALRAEQADHETAALLLGCTAGLREEIGAPMPPWHVAERDRLMQLIAAAVGADVRDRAMTKAQPMGPEDSVVSGILHLARAVPRIHLDDPGGHLLQGDRPLVCDRRPTNASSHCIRVRKRFLNPVRNVRCTNAQISHPTNPATRIPLKLTTARNRATVAMLPRSR